MYWLCPQPIKRCWCTITNIQRGHIERRSRVIITSRLQMQNVSLYTQWIHCEGQFLQAQVLYWLAYLVTTSGCILPAFVSWRRDMQQRTLWLQVLCWHSVTPCVHTQVFGGFIMLWSVYYISQQQDSPNHSLVKDMVPLTSFSQLNIISWLWWYIQAVCWQVLEVYPNTISDN